jgi:excinuclease ABC subunit A
MKRRALRYMLHSDCPLCHGKRLRKEALSVTFAGMDIAGISGIPLARLEELLRPYAGKTVHGGKAGRAVSDEKAMVIQRITQDLLGRLRVLLDLGLGYLALERSTPTLSPGELQRLRLGTQVRSNLFGVVYVLDEPSAGLHPADTEALMGALAELKSSGNSLFVVEHDLDVIRRADWIVDVGPAAGEQGGYILYSGPLPGLADVEASQTRRHLFHPTGAPETDNAPPDKRRQPKGWLRLTGITRNNLHQLDVSFPLGVMTTVTGVSGSGKSSLVSQALVELVSEALGQHIDLPEAEEESLEQAAPIPTEGRIASGLEGIRRMVVVDQKPIGRTPRSNLATYTGLFDHVRKLFASTKVARARHYDAGRFSFNVAKGRCPTCEGEGFVMVELLFLPSVYAPCAACHGARYNEKTLEVTYKDKNIAQVLGLTVGAAYDFFDGEPAIRRSLEVLLQVGLGYLRLGQPATELSGGEAQRIKLATELQRIHRGDTLYVLDEPTTGLHPSDVDKLLIQLEGLTGSGNTIVLVEHEMRVAAASDWIIDIGPGAGEEGGRVVAAGTPQEVMRSGESRTAPYLRRYPGER